MTVKRLGFSFVAMAVIVWFGLVPAMTQPTRTVRARLSGFEETPPGPFLTTASGTFTARLGVGMIDYTLSYEGLASGVLFAHIHFGQPAVAGKIVAFLCGGGGKPACPSPGGTVTGIIVPADVLAAPTQGFTAGDFDGLVRIILHGVAYANVHSNLFPGGEIRGQIRSADSETEP